MVVEAACAVLLFGALRLLPLDWASGGCGFLARQIGPRLGISRRARRNIGRAMPQLGSEAVERIVAGMWNNLGRVIAEYPHLRRFRVYEPGGRIELVDPERVRDQLNSKTSTLFFSAHYGNWELVTLPATQAGYDIVGIYRGANNPLVDRLINRARRPVGGELVPKTAVATRYAIEAIRRGRHIGMLVDQKMNEGVAAPFFGRPAMTTPLLARLALRFDCPVVPVRVIRGAGSHFRIAIEPPLQYRKTGDIAADTLALTTQVNQVIERWIGERPEQWFWLHNRWPD
ncbi:MAG TPA: lauroyl acyltransferase [Stellaceae bacterium]|nr:lauroyl acyltransferase [Stellaceae bacterium]